MLRTISSLMKGVTDIFTIISCIGGICALLAFIAEIVAADNFSQWPRNDEGLYSCLEPKKPKQPEPPEEQPKQVKKNLNLVSSGGRNIWSANGSLAVLHLSHNLSPVLGYRLLMKTVRMKVWMTKNITRKRCAERKKLSWKNADRKRKKNE